MAKPSLKAKKAYFSGVRRTNYAASLRLEGFEVKGCEGKYSSRQEAVRAHYRPAAANS